MAARGSSALFNGRSGADAAGGTSAGVAGLTAGAGLVSMVGALDVGEALTGARSGASGTATLGAGLTAGASGFGEGVSASAVLLRDPSLQGGSEQHPDTEFERGRTCCRRNIAPPRNQPASVEKDLVSDACIRA